MIHIIGGSSEGSLGQAIAKIAHQDGCSSRVYGPNSKHKHDVSTWNPNIWIDLLGTETLEEFVSVIYCAGHMELRSLATIDQHVIESHFEINTWQLFWLAKAAALQASTDPKKVRIVYISSASHRHPVSHNSVYAASKAASTQAMRCFARELRDIKNLSFVTLSPGFFNSSMYDQYVRSLVAREEAGDLPDGQAEWLASWTMSNKDPAAFAYWLASLAPMSLSGSVLDIGQLP